MDKSFAQRMSSLTTQFYARVASSFADTRQGAWPGWERVIAETGLEGMSRVRIFDVACGNLRFERFLAKHVGSVEAWCMDNNDELASLARTSNDGLDVRYRRTDVAELLLEVVDGRSAVTMLRLDDNDAWGASCDLAVSFGFMHHLPTFEQRAALMHLLLDHIGPQGYVAIAFWQFADDVRLRAKAHHAEGGGEHDYLLGWQDVSDVWRFCHHTAEDEIGELVATVSDAAREVARFSADGRTGKLNRYVVLAKRC